MTGRLSEFTKTKFLHWLFIPLREVVKETDQCTLIFLQQARPTLVPCFHIIESFLTISMMTFDSFHQRQIMLLSV